MNFTRLLIATGMLLLIAAVAVYGKLAMTGQGEFLHSFYLLMSSLLFFNLPTVLAKRRDRRHRQLRNDELERSR